MAFVSLLLRLLGLLLRVCIALMFVALRGGKTTVRRRSRGGVVYERYKR